MKILLESRVNLCVKERESFHSFAPIVLRERAAEYFSSRIQMVTTARNGRLHRLLAAFEQRTDCPVLLNTSFNGKDEPIVCTIEDAWNCFVATGLDLLVMERFVVAKAGLSG